MMMSHRAEQTIKQTNQSKAQSEPEPVGLVQVFLQNVDVCDDGMSAETEPGCTD
ncbi:hypothetical protein PAMP_016117 [Pampus punctatissimus]